MVELGNLKSKKLLDRARYLFRDREIIIRSDGKIHYFALRTWFLIVLTLSGSCTAGWVAYSTIDYWHLASQISSKNQAIWSAQNSYRQLLDQVSEYRLAIVDITKELKETQAQLLGHFNKGVADKPMDKLPSLISGQANRNDTKTRDDRVVLGKQFEVIGQELRRMTGKNNALESHIGNLRGNLETVEAEKAEMVAERAAMGDQLWNLNNELENSRIREEELLDTVSSMRSTLQSLRLEKGRLSNSNSVLRSKVSALESNLEEEVLQHKEQLRDISGRALKNIHRLEKVLNRTGLNIEKLAPLPKSMIMGVGGPFIPYHPDMRQLNGSEILEADVDVNLSRFEKLRDVVVDLPLASPIKSGYVSSHYGRRKDPFNGKWAHHRGIDFVARYKSEVRATARGIVIYVGRQGKYGRTVDIKHKFGLVTRYAHLYRYKVKRGQKVSRGETVGLLGNSGRSTGPHVHYEIKHNGKFMNPRKFLRATRNVQ
ncbi:MAG: hypothetical protein CMM58_05790 [Rhodospirillaceae bacterium]|nr:hypothetical protein [Rhodospirillaceae bacterium]|tara:strand:- start:5795 stop:7249 length:1455 start_codon:yes stop_codon:yes gene_type:complete